MIARKDQEDRVLAALALTGIRVGSIFDLVNSERSYPEAIPVLIRGLREADDPIVKEGIARALTVRQAAGKVERDLIDEFLAIESETPELQNLKWVIGNALSVVATPAFANDLINIALNSKHGRSREMVVLGLGRMKGNRLAGEALTTLLDDGQVVGHAAKALAKLNFSSALGRLRAIEPQSSGWVAKAVRAAIKKFEGQIV